ncbi:cellulase family glycosylhydrolase [Williamsia phyllosphaerae]|uniref:Glycoside hydrolase family 5 domain-containing protein n=1 Tax=Williamsia phyllosphaerae TaxID=885042 RepID=A0ABQ1UYK9_9NOCA|nr:cellulase family glycosylhydrolase [Williamsia phyllosphaerae]GGF28669.1 hypothetical protein GCM10007298_25600 [Williamsia phyllosphaerae]
MRRSHLPVGGVGRGLLGVAVVCIVAAIVAVTLTHSSERPRAAPVGPAAGSPTSSTSLGVAFPADLYWNSPADTIADFDLAAGTSLRSVRLPVFWGLVQPTDSRTYDWRVVDRLIADASRRNLSILVSIGSTPAWAAAPGSTGPYAEPADPAAYGRFVSAVATRYRGTIAAYEMWNEPNGTIFFDPRPDPVAYTALLKAGYRAVKAADPNATVVGGALGAVIDSAVTANPVDFLQQMYDAGAGGSFDALSFHPYKYDLSLGSAWTMPNSPGQQLSAMRELMLARGDGAKKIWATEFGAPTTTLDEGQQSAVIADFLDKWAELPYAGPVFLFTTRDRATGNGMTEDNFGLLRTDRSTKDAMWKVAELAHFGVPTTPEYREFQDSAEPDPAWGEALSPVVPVTRSGILGRYYQRTAVYRTPKGFLTSPAPVAALIARADTYPTTEFDDGHQDVASGGRVYWSDATGTHLVGGGVVEAWTRAFGLAITDEVPQPNGGVKVTFERGVITWSPSAGAIGMRS